MVGFGLQAQLDGRRQWHLSAVTAVRRPWADTAEKKMARAGNAVGKKGCWGFKAKLVAERDSVGLSTVGGVVAEVAARNRAIPAVRSLRGGRRRRGWRGGVCMRYGWLSDLVARISLGGVGQNQLGLRAEQGRKGNRPVGGFSVDAWARQGSKEDDGTRRADVSGGRESLRWCSSDFSTHGECT